VRPLPLSDLRSALYRDTDCALDPAALLHPDRHRDPALKSAADSRFAKVQEAYETLSDPHKRAIYDELGSSGLKTNWEVATKGKTAAEVRLAKVPLDRGRSFEE